jgi:hypothetical protein
MTNTFVPFVTMPVPAAETAPPPLKAPPQAQARAVFEPLPESGQPAAPAKNCGQPSVTLQRQGEVISGIRVECGCGQVIELACAY